MRRLVGISINTDTLLFASDLTIYLFYCYFMQPDSARQCTNAELSLVTKFVTDNNNFNNKS